MAYDAIANIIENYKVDEEMALRVLLKAMSDGHKVLSQEEFENWWIPHVS